MAAVIPGVCRQPGDSHVDPSHAYDPQIGSAFMNFETDS